MSHTDGQVLVRAVRGGGVRSVVSRYDGKAIGLDRRAALESALLWRLQHAEWRDKPGVVVCCGTATTMDVTSSDGQHLGGYIGIGLQSSLGALHDQTAALPQVAIKEGVLTEDYPTMTSSAMMMASLHMQMAWIDRERVDLARREGVPEHHVFVMLGGGYSPMIASRISEQRGVFVDPLLVLGGVAVLVAAGH